MIPLKLTRTIATVALTLFQSILTASPLNASNPEFVKRGSPADRHSLTLSFVYSESGIGVPLSKTPTLAIDSKRSPADKKKPAPPNPSLQSSKWDVDRLIKTLKEDINMRARAGAAQALGEMGTAASDEVVRELSRALGKSSNDESVNLAIANALGRIGPLARNTYSALTRAWIQNESESVRNAAHESLQLVRARDAEVVKFIGDEILTNSEKAPDVKSRGCIAIATFGSSAKPAIPRLEEALRDKNSTVRRSAITALGTLGEIAKTNTSVVAFNKLLSNADPETRALIVAAIAKIDPTVKVENPTPESQPASKPASQPAEPPKPSVESKPAPKETIAQKADRLMKDEASSSRYTRPSLGKVTEAEVQIVLTLLDEQYTEGNAHLDAVRLSLKFFKNIEELETIRIAILNSEGKTLSVKSVDLDDIRIYLKVDDEFELRRMASWWPKISK